MKHETQGAVRKLQNLQVPPSVRLDQAVRPEDLILRRNLLSEVMDQSLRKVLKVIRDPRLAVALVNAQVRMQGRAQVPLSVRLYGKVHITGKGEVVFGQGVSLTGTVVPIEFVSRRGARITIGDHTFINYGTSISARQLVSVGRDCLLGHYTFILDNNEHDSEQHRRPLAKRPRSSRVHSQHHRRTVTNWRAVRGQSNFRISGTGRGCAYMGQRVIET